MRASKVLFPLVLNIVPVVIPLALGMVIPTVAMAQTPVFVGSGLIELLPPTSVVGDGVTTNDVYLLALGADGNPLLGLKLKSSATGGTASDPVDLGKGLYKLSLVAGKVSAPGSMTVTLKGKVGSANFSKGWTIPVAPAPQHALTATANPPAVVLGQDPSASLQFMVTGGDGTADLMVVSTVGTVANVTNLGNGQYSALYTPPSQSFPQLAVLRVVDKRDPTHSYGSFALPLVGKTNYPVNVMPNGRAVLKIGDKQYGPVQADANGRAYIPIFVPPGVGAATLVAIALDNTTQETSINLQVPESKRIGLLPVPAAVPADSRVSIPVRAVVYTPDGKPDGNATVQFSVSAGQVSAAKHEGGGVYVATWTPPNSYTNLNATVSAVVADHAQVQVDGFQVSLIGARPVRVEVMTDPQTLPVGADGFRVTAKVVGSDGQGIPGRAVDFVANGAKLKGDVKDGRNGEYTAMFSTTGTGPVELAAVVPTPTSGNPLARVLVLPSRSLLPADGLSPNTITVVTVDEFGYPVPNVPVSLSLKSGDGAMPATVTTSASGIGQVYYTAGRNNAFVSIQASVTPSIIGAASFVQANANLSLPLLPPSGDAVVSRQLSDWSGSRVEVRVNRETPTPPPAAVVPTGAVMPPAATGVRPTKLSAVADPPNAAPGSSLAIRVTLTDDAGRPATGQTLEFLTSGGTVSNAVEVGPGIYQATLAVAPTVTGEVKVSVATSDGSVSTFLKIPVGAAPAAAAAWGAPTNTPPPAWGSPTPTPAPTYTPQPQPAPSWGTPTPTATPTYTPPPASPPATPPPAYTPAPVQTPPPATVPKPPKPAGEGNDRPWFKARASYDYTSYKYSQSRLSFQSDLYPNAVNVKTESGGGVPAQGAAVNARLWIPSFRYVGFDVGFRDVVYSVDPKPLCAGIGQPCPSAGAVADGVMDVHVLGVGRYYFDAGANTFHVGARLGYSYTDARVYQKTGNTIDPNDVPISGLGVGAELGADIGPKFSVLAAFTEHLSGGTVPYNTQLNVNLSYAVIDNFFLDLGYDLSMRDIQITPSSGGDPVGEVQDVAHGLMAGVGVQF